MATIEVQQAESSGTKGLKGGSLGLLAVIAIGVASTAPGQRHLRDGAPLTHPNTRRA